MEKSFKQVDKSNLGPQTGISSRCRRKDCDRCTGKCYFAGRTLVCDCRCHKKKKQVSVELDPNL